MRISLRTKVSIFVTLIIIVISLISTILFTAAHKQSQERGLLARGTAFSYALSKAAEEGLINEDLDLIKKAQYVIKVPDITLVQVYSNIWDAIDSYPFERLKEAPLPEAASHFEESDSPLYLKTGGGYDFYTPIFFKAAEDSPTIVIGYVRIVLSSAAIQKELREIVVTNTVVAAVITLFAICAINILIGGLVIKPLMKLYGSVTSFKDGIMPEESGAPLRVTNEIQELSSEFNQMCRSIKDKEERIIESDRRIRSLFERVEHAIFRLDTNGTIIEANNRFRDLFGGADAFCDILIGESSAVDCLKNAAMRKNLHIEDIAIGKSGEELLVSLTLYSETDSIGQVTGFDGYMIDITEKKRIEERLLRAQKMEAVGTLAGGMAHDFNNLLTAILGYGEIILSMTTEGDQFHKPAKIIVDAAERGADFGKKILTITRKEKIESKPVSVNDVVRNSMELLIRSIPKNIEIVMNLQEKIHHTKGDISQLQQVIMNLVVNARDAMPEGGRLTIETSVVGKENGAADISSDSGGFIKLSVADTGIGIDTVTQRKIFDPFFTTKEMGKGTGLGLYIVHSIVNNHGGYLNLYSEPMQGTQFNIYLPISMDFDKEEISDARSIEGSGTILVIDDEANVRELCRDLLQPLGYSVLLADGGDAGITVFREMKGKVQLVILDMIMPRMGGNEVFQVLKTVDPQIKVLLCSGYSQNGFAGIEELLRRGAAGFIQKPFTRNSISVAIKKALSS